MTRFTRLLSLMLLNAAWLLQPVPASAQVYQGCYDWGKRFSDADWIWEINAGIGGMNALTDVYTSSSGNPGPRFQLYRTQLAGSVGVTATYRDWLALRFDITAGRVEGNDSDILRRKDTDLVKELVQRNQSFKSHITEVSLMAEIHPWAIRTEPGKISPYAVGGIGWFDFEPYTWLDGERIQMRPLRVEGQGTPDFPKRKIYKGHALSLAMGAGIRCEVAPRINLRFEFIGRYTSTDHLDDMGWHTWAPYTLYDSYLSPEQADLARRLHARSFPAQPLDQEKTRNVSWFNDVYWTAMVRVGYLLQRQRRRY